MTSGRPDDAALRHYRLPPASAMRLTTQPRRSIILAAMPEADVTLYAFRPGIGAMRNPVFLGLALSVATTLASAKSHDGDRQQADAATRAVFSVLAADREHPQRCEYDVEWGRYAVPGWLARETIGLTLDVDVSASEEPLRIQDAIDPKAISKESFCSEKDYTTYLDQRNAEKSQASVTRVSLTYPVFNKERNTAIIVVMTREEGGLITLSGATITSALPSLR